MGLAIRQRRSSDAEMIVLGNGGHAREVRALASTLGWNVVSMLGEGRDREVPNKYPMAMGIGTPAIKRKLAKQYANATWPTLQHYHSSVNANVGVGCIITAGAVLAEGVVTGDFCLFNFNCVVGHGAQIGRCVTISPCVVVCGDVVIEDNVFVGAGAVVLPGVTIGEGSVIGACAAVANDVPSRSVAAGIAARVIEA